MMVAIHQHRGNCQNRYPFQRNWYLMFLFLCFGLFGSDDRIDLTEIPLEELMRIEVTLASRHQERFTDASAAVYVLTGEDIIQSGATSIPEALRMVPGMEVGHMDANKWAVSVRGFNSIFANKLLVLIDGRTIYNPIFSGVIWDAQDVILRDVKQIEVVRGPGGSLWGSNAVNGVINIITKSAEETQGGYICLGGGTEERQFSSIRYGGSIGKWYYRTFAKFFSRSEFVDENGKPAADSWHMFKTGLRMDGLMNVQNRMTIITDYYQNNVGQTLFIQNKDYTLSRDFRNQIFGGYFLARWRHLVSDKTQWILQSYLDFFKREEILMIGGRVLTWDVDFQYSKEFKFHRLTLGGGFRDTWDKFNNSEYIQLIPMNKNYYIANGFFQDDIKLIRDKWYLIWGSKFEYHSLSGWEIQPSLRSAYHFEKEGMIWIGISRAVRTPVRIDQNIVSEEFIAGNPDVKSEELLALEMGARYRPVKRLYIDASFFSNYYDNLVTFEPVVAMNKKQGHVYGFELALDYQVAGWMKIRSGYSRGQSNFRLDNDSQDPYSQEMDREMPRYQGFLQTHISIGSQWKWTVNVRYVDSLIGSRIYTEAYLNLNSRISYSLSDALEFSVVGQNLLEDRHVEFNGDWIPFKVSRVPRGMYAQMNWWF
ncbi:TonB-dependent receptor [bacterium]|nr:TonB-dependent receptor [bacterium]